jgi:hypothetical protein
VDGPTLATKPAAKVIVVTTSSYQVYNLSLDSTGHGARTVPFAPGIVTRINLVLTNTSRRYDTSSCWTGTTTYSCGGAVARDELRLYRFKAAVR